jgi:hypothetical protein
MVVAGILVAALAVGSTIGVALGRYHHDQQATPATTTTTIPTSSQPIADRSTQCSDGINAAGQRVKDLLLRAPGADAAAARSAITDARQQCADLLPECPAIADAYAGWLEEGVAQAVAGPATTVPLGDPPALTCSVAP